MQSKMFPVLSGCQIGKKQFATGMDLLLSERKIASHDLVAEEAPREGFAPLLIVNEEDSRYCVYSDLLSSPLQFDSPIFGLIAFYDAASDAWAEMLGTGGEWKTSTYSAVWKSKDEIELRRDGRQGLAKASGRIIEIDHSTRWLVLKSAKGVPLGATIINNVPKFEVLGAFPDIAKTGAFKNDEIRKGFLRLLTGRVHFEGFPKIGSVVGVLP
ncbi:hypothetical protein [Mesoterricola sediminis]|nr:hypothetical protein [Mesoterricola sediminis]